MTADSTHLVITSYTGPQAREVLSPVIVPLWEDIYGTVAADDEFFSTGRFLERFDSYAAAPGFSLSIAATEGTDGVVGIAFGYALPSMARWWRGLQTSEPSGFTDEDGRRTFAINEIMVIESQRRKGIATALHHHLLYGREESRATLLVEPDNVAARKAYLSWGWRKVGMLKPFPDSPSYESMIIDLPLVP